MRINPIQGQQIQPARSAVVDLGAGLILNSIANAFASKEQLSETNRGIGNALAKAPQGNLRKQAA